MTTSRASIGPFVGQHDEAASRSLGLALDLLGIALGAELRAGAVRGLQQAAVIERGMELAGALDHHAAIVIVGGDLLALPVARHHVGAETGARIVGADLGGLLGVVARREGAAEAAAHAPVALDALALDHRLHLGERVGGIGQHARHDLLPFLGVAPDALARETLAESRAAADAAAVARRGADAELAAATSNLAQAAADFERYAKLKTNGWASVADFDRKKAASD